MFSKFKAARWLPLWAVAGLPFMLGSTDTSAQATAPAPPAASSARPDPADPKAAVPASLYASPLRAYQALAEPPPVAPWRETNERVRERGGWRAYAREK